MKLTFGIITDGKSPECIEHMIHSIESQLIPHYEILIIGCHGTEHPHTRIIEFNEAQRAKGWITKKKNLITELAEYDTIIYAHDYIYFPDGWYEGWTTYGSDWNIAVNRVYSMEGPRHADWLVLAYDMWDLIPESHGNWDVALPYGTRGANAIQYISGGFFAAKRKFMQTHPLDESLVWGEAEDVAWCRSFRDTEPFAFNRWSYVQLMKPNKWKPGLIKPEYLDRMAKLKNLKIYYEP